VLLVDVVEAVVRENVHGRRGRVEGAAPEEQPGRLSPGARSRESHDPGETEQLAGHRVGILRDPLWCARTWVGKNMWSYLLGVSAARGAA
jgi:hypothetical protein